MKKNLMTVLILALLVVNIVLNCIVMISVTGTNKKTASLVNNIATALSLEFTSPDEEVVQVSLEDTAPHILGEKLMFPLASGADGKQSYLVCTITLSMNKKHKDYKKYGESIADRNGLIEDAITTVVASHTMDECRNDLEGLKEEMLKAIQDLFDSDFIYQVAVSGVTYG
ncbi:MAG: flagellar basal body-associated FliL family protein [Lachnoclostridium sp.]|nr:flagellar basal body-associated FliL family protein [Lachnospira sp.]MCM1246830.1 flagellar basal body-associated FliL family protein [Lachnoclostridium sp.]